MTVLATVFDLYDQAWAARDDRMDNLWLMDSPFVNLVLCLLYVQFSLFFGPKLMTGRDAFQLKKTIIFYNICMVLINAFLFKQTWCSNVKLIGDTVNTSRDPETIYETRMVYAYFLTKYLDWADTVFFVLRKKFSHITVLHVYHHCIMPINSWLVTRYIPGGQIVLAGFINTFIHVIMYTYYSLAAFGPHMQKYLWWKKYITMLQLTQFVLGLFIGSLMYKIDPSFPKGLLTFFLPQGVIFLILFGNFYYQTYVKRLSSKKDE